MLIKIQDEYIKKKYTILNKDVEWMRVAKKKWYWFKRNINLYTKDFYLPNWAKQHQPQKPNRHTNTPIDVKYNWNLKESQMEALLHIIVNEWWLIEAPTWYWKSHLVMALVAHYKLKTLIVTPTKKLVAEMVEKFKEFTNYIPWTYYSDWKEVKDITITTHMSFVDDILNKKELPKFDLVCIDELDTGLSPAMIEALCYCDCNILVWLTWTAYRQNMDSKDLELIFGPYIKVWEYQIKPSSFTHYVYKRDWLRQAQIDYTNWHTVRESILANKERYENIKKTIAEIREKSFLTLILLDRNSEVEKFSLDFPEALVITWQTKIKDDVEWIEKLKKSWGLIIWALKKMYRWVDIPEIDYVLIASPIKFQSTVIQSIWRALRSHKDKKEVNIWIINDNVLNTQRYQQTSVIKQQYWLNPAVVYI